jgi:mannose-6-phosphate isomerase-like protein (cupin superfamily)
MPENEFLIDLKIPPADPSAVGHNHFPNGEVSSDVRPVTPAEGPHGLYWCLDTLMHKNPADMDASKTCGSHFHWHGYETFFVDSGSLWLFINGQKVFCKKGDIVHFQPGQSQGFFFLEDVKWRGTYHDFEVYPEYKDVMKLKRLMPEYADDPALPGLAPRGMMDSNPMEPFLTEEAPVESCTAVKNLARPHAKYEFPGCTMNVMIERWENGGTRELECAVLEPGFTAEWDRFPETKELFYVRSGKVKFKIYDKEFIADGECVVIAPKFAPRSIEALKRTELYELGGQPYWSLFLQSYASIKKYDPARLTPETLAGLKKKFGIQIEKIGMK